MFDREKIDHYFQEDSLRNVKPKTTSSANRHSRIVHWAKLLLPSIAAVLIGTLLIYPSLKTDTKDFKLDITRPKKGELEKLHVENTVLYVTDKNNRINNFVAKNIDETAPGSKLVKLTSPEGMLPVNDTDWANIKAPTGYFDQNQNTMSLTDNVEIFYSEGMSLQTPDATFDFNSSKGFGKNGVTADGYFGSLKADGFEFSTQDDILVFTGHSDITIKEESLKGR